MPVVIRASLAFFLTSSAVAAPLTFEKDVRPILKAQCFHCHGEEGEPKGGLDVRLVRFLLKGGESGPAIHPGQAEKSHLLKLVKAGEMPKGKNKLKAEEITTLERWITQGAPTARPEPERLGPEHVFTEEERAWWAFQPIRKPKVEIPSGLESAPNPVDVWVAKQLSAKGLKFSPQAEARTLIRRLSLDLTGLPPTPEEVEAFVAASHDPQQAEAAYPKLVDRLLNSNHYGERWGRHWLDLAGYADSDGYTDKDLERPWAWKYRDYVIAAFNQDKPFDAFVREQIAGDELVPQPHRNLRPEDIEKITATGFLRMAPDGTGAMNDKIAQNANIADTIKIISTAFYGMTIGCAQCHDHRYDPITQADYYRLRAIFEPGFNPSSWKTPAARLVSLLTDQEKQIATQIEEDAKKLDAQRLKQQEFFITEVLEKELAKAPEKDRDALRLAYRTEVKKRTPAKVALLKVWPRIQQLSAGSLYLYDTTYRTRHADTLKRMTEEAAAVRAKKPKEEFLHALDEAPMAATVVPATYLFHRGEPDQPQEIVKPSDLSVLAVHRQIEIPEKNPAMPTTGRRLAFAEALTDGKHPLLARVIVNQVWLRHFGRGLVNTPNDFGQLGEKPTHPELLDWLAAEFMEQGWSLKRLHRQILLSRTWRQSSVRDAARDEIDPDNRWLSRMNVRRLDAETLRDGLLAVSGRLNPKVGGKPVPVTFNEEGQVIIGVDTPDTAGRQTGKFIPMNGEDQRRSIYVQARRSTPLEMFAAFDAPAMTDTNCAMRPNTTVSPQSLLLMNNLYMREHAQDLAQRVQSEAGSDGAKQVARAWWLAFQRQPSMAEEQEALHYLHAQKIHYQNHPAPLERASGPGDKRPASSDLLALSTLCHALLSSNEFLYMD